MSPAAQIVDEPRIADSQPTEFARSDPAALQIALNLLQQLHSARLVWTCVPYMFLL